MTKRTIFKIIGFIVTFLITLLVLENLMNMGSADMTGEMAPASLPTAFIVIDGNELNMMHGYTTEMDPSSMHETITPIPSSRELEITIHPYDVSIRSLSFEVRSSDGERLVENTQIDKYTSDEGVIHAKLILKDLIEAGKEYNLILLLQDINGNQSRYYTRIIETEDYHVEEKLEYVLSFHEKLFSKAQAIELTSYLEPNSSGDNSTYAHVDIHSSFEQVTYGDLNAVQYGDTYAYITELHEQTGNIRLEYQVLLGTGTNRLACHATELYRIRYTADRMYLLSYDRYMSQDYDERDLSLYTKNKISLGIHLPGDVEIRECDGGSVFAFTIGNRLFCYDIAAKKLSLLFSFYDSENNDARTRYDMHRIKILDVEETGNVTFMVYGYMNRGLNEGKVGIQISYFDSQMNTIEELCFIPYKKAANMLLSYVGRETYLSRSGVLYMNVDNNLFEIGLEDRTARMLVSGLGEDNCHVSDSQKMFVWEEKSEDDIYGSSVLQQMDFSDGKTTSVHADPGTELKALGFMGEDLIYGIARKSDIQKETATVIFPMYELIIADEVGNVLKRYSQDGYYVTDCTFVDNQINLTRVTRTEDGQYVAAEEDQIVNNETVTTDRNVVEKAVTESYQTVLQISAKSELDTEGLSFPNPPQVLFEGGREMALKSPASADSSYFLYEYGEITGIYANPANALMKAYEVAGIVYNNAGNVVWYKGNRVARNQIMAITGSQSTENSGNLATCLDTMLEFAGKSRNTQLLLDRGLQAEAILRENLPEAQVLNLSGCPMDAILYFVNKDIPVLGVAAEGREYLVIGFNDLNIVVMDPKQGDVYKVGMNDATEMFAEGGNTFITYLPAED
ncbi:MAG: hypothetical protein K5682_11150 [Lachnospiraceae bacterium]|nr:hypothetical protein [Lachnospiraceae bacterium]